MEAKRMPGFVNAKNVWLVPAVISLTTILAMGLRVGQFGLYGNQWKIVLSPPIQSSAYPLGTLIQQFLTNAVGTNVLIYHFVNDILFIICGYILYNLLVKLQFGKAFSLAGALLFIVSPAFNFPAAAFELSTILVGLIVSLLSVVLTLSALTVEKNRSRKLIFAGICALLALFSHPLIVIFQSLIFFPMYFACGKDTKMKSWLLGIATVNITASVIILLRLQEIKIDQIPALIRPITYGWLNSFVLCWRQIITMPGGGGSTVIYIALLALGIVSLFFILSKIQAFDDERDQTNNNKIIVQSIFLLAAVVTGILYILIATVFDDISFSTDLGMLIVGLFSGIALLSFIRLIFLEDYQMILIAVVIVLATGNRFLISERYVSETRKVDDFLAQLHVRGDTFKADTNILVEQLPFDFTSRGSLESLLVKKFSPTNDLSSSAVFEAEQPEIGEFLNSSSEKTIEIVQDGKRVEVNKKSIISIWMPENGCVQILEPGMIVGNLPEGLGLSKDYSNPNLFQVNDMSDVKQLNQFRTTIIEDWCFFFQIANRWMQQQRWDDAINEYSNAEALNLKPKRYQEYFPLLKAQISIGKIQEAENVSMNLITNPSTRKTICDQWDLILSEAKLPEEEVAEARKAQISIGCN